MTTFQWIEDALCKSIRFGQGAEVGTNKHGDRVAYIYNYDWPSEHGGYERVELNLTTLARELERELS